MLDIQIRFSKIFSAITRLNFIFCLLLFIFILLKNCELYSQPWIRILSQPSSFSNNIIRIDDGGYLVSGATTAYGPPKSNAMLIKLDSVGKWQWQVVLGSSINEYGFRAIQNAGGDIFVVSSPFLLSAVPYSANHVVVV
jgi:hypothetical protein